jgi:molybdopterin converting factor small subunit
MSQVTIRIPAPLRGFTGGAGEVNVTGETVLQALEALETRHGGLLPRILDPTGNLRGFVNIYVGERSVRALGGLAAPLPEGAVISIVPAVAGGRCGAIR